MGNAQKASAEKGEEMWRIMIEKMVEFVESIKSTPLQQLYQNRY
jgi:creatinine amidohydrolase